ncbi:MAG: Gfo/Idh/MocA family oxidoreductase [Lachnospiraceae bacterium]
MCKVIKAGVIGLGHIAHIAELPALSEMEHVEIAAVYSRSDSSVEVAMCKYKIGKGCRSFEEFMNTEMDCAFVLTPKTAHYEYVISLLDKGIDVFCEKPLALTLRESREMAEAAKRNNRILMVGFNRRYAPVYAKVKELYMDKAPDVVIAQKNRNGTEYRATLENAIHMVDLMRYLCGEALLVEAHSMFTDPEYEDLVTAQIKFDSGSTGILVASRKAGQWVEKIDCYGGYHSAFVNAPDSVTLADEKTETKTVMTPLALGWARVEDKMGFTQEVRHFIDCVITRKQPVTNAEDAYKTHELMHEILIKAGLPGLE